MRSSTIFAAAASSPEPLLPSSRRRRVATCADDHPTGEAAADGRPLDRRRGLLRGVTRTGSSGHNRRGRRSHGFVRDHAHRDPTPARTAQRVPRQRQPRASHTAHCPQGVHRPPRGRCRRTTRGSHSLPCFDGSRDEPAHPPRGRPSDSLPQRCRCAQLASHPGSRGARSCGVSSRACAQFSSR